MSKTTHICCSICGRNLYKSFNDFDEETVRHVEYYMLNTQNGEEQICCKCYGASFKDHFMLKDTTSYRGR